MMAISDAAMRRFEYWADDNSAAGAEFRYDPGRQPWPVEYDAAGVGIDNDRWARPEQVRILFLPHGFAMDNSREGDLGNWSRGIAWAPPVTLLASMSGSRSLRAYWCNPATCRAARQSLAGQPSRRDRVVGLHARRFGAAVRQEQPTVVEEHDAVA